MVHFSGISPDILDRFSESFYHMKALYKQMMDLYLIFQFVKGRCHGNQFSGKNGAKLPTPALIALPFRNIMGYHNCNMRVNSVTDASILCESFIKFGSVNPELTLLICE